MYPIIVPLDSEVQIVCGFAMGYCFKWLSESRGSSGSVYGLDHVALNAFPTRTTWLNLGLRDADNIGFIKACENLVRAIAVKAEIKAGDKILDVGYGCGDQDFLLWKEFNPSEIVGVTLEEKHQRMAVSKFGTFSGAEKCITFLKGDATQLDATNAWERGPFDHVIAVDAAYHFHTRRRFFEQAKQLLHRNGKITLADVVLQDPGSPGILRSMLRCILLRFVSMVSGLPRSNLVTIQEYTNHLEGSGFRNITFDKVEDKVLPGCARDLRDIVEASYGVLDDSLSTKYTRIASILEMLYKWKAVHYVIVSAEVAQS